MEFLPMLWYIFKGDPYARIVLEVFQFSDQSIRNVIFEKKFFFRDANNGCLGIIIVKLECQCVIRILARLN